MAFSQNVILPPNSTWIDLGIGPMKIEGDARVMYFVSDDPPTETHGPFVGAGTLEEISNAANHIWVKNTAKCYVELFIVSSAFIAVPPSNNSNEGLGMLFGFGVEL